MPVTNPLPQLIPQRLIRLRSTVEAMCWERSESLRVSGGPINAEMLPLARGQRQRMSEVSPGEFFGPPRGGWQQRWFRLDIPAAARGEAGRRFLQWDCDGETTVYADDKPWAGLDLAHRTCPLPDAAKRLWLDCSTWQTGIWIGRPGMEAIGPHGLRFDGCRLRLRDRLAWDVRWDLDIFTQLVTLLYERDGLRGASVWGHQPPLESCSPLLRQLLRGLDDACDVFAREGLAALRDALRDVARTLPAETWQPIAALCGHAHIDVVWLWPEVATERKAVHSFATQLRLLERYPEMTFVQSQPALYRAVEKLAPALMPQIRRRIREGRWEAMGVFEVEPDTNLPSGEALVRSMLCGQEKIAELSGKPSTVCWIPDVFGYANCLPQILALGGVRSFYTTKMTWSAVTRFPYNSFVWRGADGSEVVAHLCSTNYNGSVELRDISNALREHRQADVHPEMLLPTGFGDGGGGVVESMVERARRIESLAGIPRAKWTTTGAFFRRLERVRERLPVYQGELYLEYHRGTYTTQSEYKRLYRGAEVALQAHEAVRVLRGGPPLDPSAWQRVALAQFHDAIPGSSIGIVYRQLNRELAEIGAAELGAACGELVARSGSTLLFNPLTQPRTAVIELADEGLLRRAPQTLKQKVGRGVETRWLAAVSLGALEAADLGNCATATQDVPSIRHATPTVLDNSIVRAELDEKGQLRAVSVDGEALELSAPAGFALYHDQPANFDAWDIDHYTVKTGRPVAEELALEVIERGPLRARLRGSAPIGERSRLIVDYVLDAGARHLRVEAQVEWRETHRLLKFHLPTDYRGRFARYGCPFGSIERPQAPGVAADEAMWEVPGSRWAAVTRDDGTGLAICSEAKFGFSCREGNLGLSLLRSPKEPDPTADMGVHRIRFAIGRHEPAWRDGIANTASAAEALFAPLLLGRGLPSAPLFAWQHLGGLVPSWALPSADGRGYVLRLHETAGGSGTARISFAAPPRGVELVDLRERRLAPVPAIRRGEIAIPYAPYQILSLRVRP